MKHCIGSFCASPGPCACSCADCISLRRREASADAAAKSLTGETLAERVKLEHRASEILLAWRQGLTIWDAVLVVADELVAFERKYGAER